jgi:hypothetical protein
VRCVVPRRFCCSEDRSSSLIQEGRPSLFWAEIGPGGQAKCRPRPSPTSVISRRAGSDQNRSMGRFRLKYFLSVFHFSETGISLFN